MFCPTCKSFEVLSPYIDCVSQTAKTYTRYLELIQPQKNPLPPAILPHRVRPIQAEPGGSLPIRPSFYPPAPPHRSNPPPPSLPHQSPTPRPPVPSPTRVRRMSHRANTAPMTVQSTLDPSKATCVSTPPPPPPLSIETSYLEVVWGLFPVVKE